MATLVFGALGTLVGGPLGGAIGSLLGREVDHRIIGSGRREGPRLKELAVSASSYGQPIARLFGVTRAGGTIIWSTDLRETGDEVGGGKGQPKTTQYSYSVSLAVALSSRPVSGVGRIWADGNLLRGAAGDLKTGGSLRIHTGLADQAPDPLLAAALGAGCPAHRGLAYAVFEDLALGDFGNRIPALSFEVFADGAGTNLPGALAACDGSDIVIEAIPEAATLQGFAQEGGSIADALEAIAAVATLTVTTGARGVVLAAVSAGEAVAPPALIEWPDGEFGQRTGRRTSRDRAQPPGALRYYDRDRDYQPGLQRSAGRAPLAGERTLELPATMTAADARALVETMRQRAAQRTDRVQLRIASLDARFAPGRLVALGDSRWRVEGWEWREGGIELELVRHTSALSGEVAGDSGQPWRPADRLGVPTLLEAFEIPWDGIGPGDVARVHAAASAADGRWAGAALYAGRADGLVRTGTAGSLRAVTGTLTGPLAPSPAVVLEAAASLELACDWRDAPFASIDEAALAAGGNRLLIGGEILQFMRAEPLDALRWRLSGLLRGRGGTEIEAGAGHAIGARAVLLDERLVALDASLLDPSTPILAAIGTGDTQPVFADVRDPGRSRRPLAPVHPSVARTAGGGLILGWTRRARGSWWWRDGVDAPLQEEAERYEVGAGPIAVPHALWPVDTPSLELTSAEVEALPASTALWVRQIGDFARSPALHLHITS